MLTLLRSRRCRILECPSRDPKVRSVALFLSDLELRAGNQRHYFNSGEGSAFLHTEAAQCAACHPKL